ncbi:MAG: TadE/TadG family type IV pilus assembly protein [bacterium]
MHSSASKPDSGQATVELALVMPLIIGLLLIILTAGLVVRDQLAVWHAASAGARAASISPDSPDVVQQAVESEVQLRPIHLRIVREGDLITVEAKYPRTIGLWLFKFITPPLILSATVTMHVQDVG